jgi:hydrogenase/urease accessory protein HupE
MAGLCLTGLLTASPATAHDFSTSYSQFTVEGDAVRVTLTLGLNGLHAGPALDADGNGEVDRMELETAFELLRAAIEENYSVTAPDPPLTTSVAGWDLTDDGILRLRMVHRFAGDVKDLTVRSRLDRITQENHRHLLQIGENEDARYGVLTSDADTLTIDYAAGIPLWATVLDFIQLGIEHIFTGYDHLAFLVGLLLVTSTVMALVRVVTFFTVGHSVTLALATLGWVVIPSGAIESLIALSIAYIGVENFLGKRLLERRFVTGLFGLVHGFGFSNVLRNMNMPRGDLAASLFSFNLGVEIGQLAFVAVAFPLLFYLAKTRWSEHIVAGVSVAIMSVGFYWFVQRALAL